MRLRYLPLTAAFAGVVIAVLIAVLVSSGRSAHASPGDTTADYVLGQPFGNFTAKTGTCLSSAVAATNFCAPSGLAFDAGGRLYVVDRSNSRVLEFDTPLTNAVPQRVFGQPNFATSGCNLGGTVSASTLCYPEKVTVDPAGNLYVSDALNSRVLEYDVPVGSCSTCDTVADRVFGQPTMSTNAYNNGGVTAKSMALPWAVSTDSSGNLFVTDGYNNRVLEYDDPVGSCSTCDTVADRVLGQGNAANFTSNTANFGGISAGGFDNPFAVAVDSGDRLWVSEMGNGRILEFDTPITSLVANRVIGQTTFTSGLKNGGGSTSASGVDNVTGIRFDAAANLYVSETGNERGLEYNNPLTTDKIADVVFGQLGSFSGNKNNLNTSNASADSLVDPWDIAVHGCNVWIADIGNARVLEYDSPPNACVVPPTATATSTVCPVSVCTATPTDTATPTATASPTTTSCGPGGTCTPTATPSPCLFPPCGPATPTDTPTATPTCDGGPIACSPTPTATCLPLPCARTSTSTAVHTSTATRTPTPTIGIISLTPTPTIGLSTATPTGNVLVVVDCDPATAGLQTSCAYNTSVGVIDVDVVVLNNVEPATSIDGFGFKLHDPDTSRLALLPGADQNLNGNPNFNSSAVTGSFSCTPPPPAPDTGEDGAGRAVSFLSCRDAAVDGPTLGAFRAIGVARVHYAVPQGAQSGDVRLSLSDLVVSDALNNPIASCSSSPAAPVSCVGATLHLTSSAVGGVAEIETSRRNGDASPAARGFGSSRRDALSIGGGVLALVLVIATSATYARRRRLR